MRCKRRVVIVGAGTAGAAAASKLLIMPEYKDAEIIILESAAEAGGRTKTKEVGGVALDLGARWIEGCGKDADGNTNPLTTLALHHNVHHARVTERRCVIPDNPTDQRHARQLHKRAMLLVLQRQTELSKDSTDCDPSVLQVYDSIFETETVGPEVRLWMGFHLAHMEQYCGTSMNKHSTKYFDLDGSFGGSDAEVLGGYGTVIQKEIRRLVEAGCVLELRSPVVAVNDAGAEVKVEIAGGRTILADAVIITVPIGVLKARRISFAPALPVSHAAAIERIGVASFNKIFIQFESCFWDESLGEIQICNEMRGWLRFWKCCSENGTHMMQCLMGGDPADQLEQMSDTAVLHEASAVLSNALNGGEALPKVIWFHCTRWGSDPHTLGAFSSFSVGANGPHDLDSLTQPIMDGKVVFAGEHTHGVDYCSVHGAYLSGVRAAKQLEAVESNCLCTMS